MTTEKHHNVAHVRNSGARVSNGDVLVFVLIPLGDWRAAAQPLVPAAGRANETIPADDPFEVFSNYYLVVMLETTTDSAGNSRGSTIVTACRGNSTLHN